MILVALFAGASQAQEIPKPPGERGKQSYGAKAPPPVQEPYKGNPRKPSCDAPNSWEEIDFCAQSRMAEAAEKTLIWIRRTYELGKVQAGLLIVTLLITAAATVYAGKAARAAQKSADAIPKIERAYMFVTVDGFGSHENGGHIEVWARIKIVNHGKTPAILRRVHAVLTLAALNDEIKPDFQHDMKRAPLPPGIVVGAGEDHSVGAFRTVTKEELDNVDNGNIALFCVGKVEYDTVVMPDRVTGYCWVHSRLRSDFHISEKRDLNYYT